MPLVSAVNVSIYIDWGAFVMTSASFWPRYPPKSCVQMNGVGKFSVTGVFTETGGIHAYPQSHSATCYFSKVLFAHMN